MKKINSKGFALAETLIVTVFLMVIFTMIYANFVPLVGEYEKREYYDDVNGKYSTYWIKKLIEDPDYQLTDADKSNFQNNKYVRFNCSNISGNKDKIASCINLLRELSVTGCDNLGDNCEIFITNYRLGDNATNDDFKDIIKTSLKKYKEGCTLSDNECQTKYMSDCTASGSDNATCESEANKNVFRTGFKDYVRTLPDYSTESLNNAKFRVLVSYHHKKDNNNFYSYATMEVIR